MKLRFLVRAVDERAKYVGRMCWALPELEVLWADGRDAMDTYLDAICRYPDEHVVHLEDDVILTVDFVSKLRRALVGHEGEVVQFFSMRRKDLEVGSRYDRTFMMTQCFHLPPGYGPEVEAFSRTWPNIRSDRGGIDMVLRDWLKSRKEPYWLHVPSLVEHRDLPSAISPRSTKRQSFTFQDPAHS